MHDHNVSRGRPIVPGASTPAAGPVPPVRIRALSSGARPTAYGRGRWALEFDPSKASALDPLTGWTVSTDPLTQVRMTFPDLQSAIAFAERKGWRYAVDAPSTPPRRSKIPLRHAPPGWPFSADPPTNTDRGAGLVAACPLGAPRPQNQGPQAPPNVILD